MHPFINEMNAWARGLLRPAKFTEQTAFDT
jgi:hypothetical protein